MSATPVVPCVQLSTGQPPAGGRPTGIDIVPDTAMSCPASVLEWYRMSRFSAAPGRAAGPVTCRDQITWPAAPGTSGEGGR